MNLIDTVTLADVKEDFPAVLVNGNVIEEALILREMQYHQAESIEEARYKAAYALIVKELLLERARELRLSAELITGENEEEALIRTLLALEVQQPIPTEEDCERYFAANRDKFKTPTLLAASHILVSADPKDPEAREQVQMQANMILEQLQNTPDLFSALAKQYSDCPSKELNGELGQLDKGQTVPEFERQIFTMAEGLCLYPVETRYGFHVVRIDKRVEGDPLPYNMVADRIATYLKDQVYRRSINQYISLLAGQASIEGIHIQGAESLLVQ